MDLEAAKLIAGAIALIPILGVGIGVGLIFSSYNEAIGRNPGAADLLEKKFLISFALTEALGILAFLVSAYLVFA